MSTDLVGARKTPLFNAAELTTLLWAPQSRKQIDELVAIVQNEALFRKAERCPSASPHFHLQAGST